MGIQLKSAEIIVGNSQENKRSDNEMAAVTSNGAVAAADLVENNDDDNREEGEIVEDEFEDIISSDEELSMRKRIAELEARNSELEKLADISGFYSSYDVGYAADRHKPTAGNDHSDTETFPPAKHNKSNAVKTRSKSRSRYVITENSYRKFSNTSPNYDEQLAIDHRKSRKRKYAKSSRNHSRKKERLRKRSRLDYSSSEDEFCSVDRNVLRMALRHEPVSVAVNEKTLVVPKMQTNDACATIILEEPEVKTFEINDDSDKQAESDESESLEIQELRLIALKSAFLKKGKARKERKEMEEKKPYSPTDCLAPIISIENDLTNSSPNNFLENEACNSMDISPVASPDILNDDSIAKPIDMELVDSSNSSSPIFLESSELQYSPIHPAIRTPQPSRDSEETENPQSPEKTQLLLSPIAIRLQSVPSSQLPPLVSLRNDTKIESRSAENSSPEPLDEEVNALRALLLAQKNSPKYNRNIRKIKSAKHSPSSQDATNSLKDGYKSEDQIDCLIRLSKENPDKTASILKEAVKRLKNKTKPADMQPVECEQHSIDVVNTNHFVRMTMPATNMFPNDVDYRIFNTFTNFAPVKPISPSFEEFTTVVKIKERQETRSASRPNIIEIIPTEILPMPSKRSPVTVIPKTVLETSESKVIINVPVKPVVINELPSSPDQKPRNIPKIIKPAIVQTKPVEPAPPSTVPSRSPRKKSLTSLEALQLKTQNLILNGKMFSRNKMVATKLLNKAIHQNALTTKRKTLLVNQPGKLSVALVKSVADERLITKVDVPPVKQLIICVNTKSESEESDLDSDGGDKIERVENETRTIGTFDDDDVASPMSLPMESPCDSPLTVAAAVSATTNLPTASVSSASEVKTKSIASNTPAGKKTEAPNSLNDSFQLKLDEFLKNARSKVDSNKKEPIAPIAVSPITPTSKTILKNSTPLAVRHLPLSAQLEYRRLVNRMQILEKQKTTRIQPPENIKVTIKNSDKSPIRSVQSNSSKLQAIKENTSPELRTPTIICVNNKSPLKATIQNTNSPTSKELKESNTPKVISPSVDRETTKVNKLPNLTVVRNVNITVAPKKVTSRLPSKPIATPRKVETKKVQRKKINTLRKSISSEPSTSKGPGSANVTSQSSHKDKISIPQFVQPRTVSECEQQYRLTSTQLLDNIAVTIDLVTEAQSQKFEKLKLENEIVEIRKRLTEMEKQIEQRDVNISKILPNISQSYKNVSTLKTQTLHLDNFANDLCEKSKTERNKFFAEQKSKIRRLLLDLSMEIKKLKSIKTGNAGESDNQNEKVTESIVSAEKAIQVDVTNTDDDIYMPSKEDEDEVVVLDDNNTGGVVTRMETGLEKTHDAEEACDETEPSLKNCDKSENVQSSNLVKVGVLTESCESGTPPEEAKTVAVVEELCPEIVVPECIVTVKCQEFTKEYGKTTRSYTGQYISPLDFSCDQNDINPNGILCPYQLMGQCDDKECKFEHLKTPPSS